MPIKDNSEEKIFETDTNFYSDTEATEMLNIEHLLNHCDETDLKILNGLISGLSYSEIAEKNFMSVNGIKYKLKIMFNLCKVKTKSEFITLISKYNI